MKAPAVGAARFREARRAAQALAVVAVMLVVYGLVWAESAQEFGSYLFVVLAALLPGLIWIRSGAQGIPVLPAVAFLYILYFAVPIVRGTGLQFEYRQTDISRAAVTVGGFLVAATVASQAILMRSRKRAGGAPIFATDRQIPTLVLLGLGVGIAFHAFLILGLLSWLGSFFGVVRAVAMTALVVSSYLLGVARARGLLRGHRWALAAAGFGSAILLNWISFFLVGGIMYALAAGLGYVTTSKRVPWLLAFVAFAVVTVLHAGKAEMRAKYWAEGSNSSGVNSVLDVPAIAAEWVQAGLKALISGADVASVMERTSLHQMLLRVQRLTPSYIPYLEGETYALLPQMLVPRFLSPQKTASQAGMDLLNIRYGLLSVEGAAVTAIGWGLVAEAYANYGQVGVLGVGFFLGLACGSLMRWSAGALPLSRPTLLAIVVMMGLLNIEADMAGLVTSLAQATVAMLIFFGVFRLLSGHHRRPVILRPSASTPLRPRA